jgi:hypothetical protein
MEIDDIIKIPERHSFFQLEYFVIGKEPTIQSKLWRCIREIKSRKDTLSAMELQLEKMNDELEFLHLQKPEPYNGVVELDKKKAAIAMRDFVRRDKSMQHDIEAIIEKQKETKAEMDFLFENYKKLEQIEKLKPWDNYDVQQEYWNQKLTQELNMKLLFRSNIDTELLKTILSLEDSTPIKVQTLNMVERIKQRELMALEAAKK